MNSRSERDSCIICDNLKKRSSPFGFCVLRQNPSDFFFFFYFGRKNTPDEIKCLAGIVQVILSGV